MELNLKGKRVLVTGSSRGIGLGIARAFVGEGAEVIVTGRDARVLRQALAQLGPASRGVRGDLTRATGIRAALAVARKRWGALDILVLNLGSGRSVPGLAADGKEWRRVLDLNLVAAMEMLRGAEPLLAKGEAPAVVFIGSIAGLEVLGAPIAYGAAKAALMHAMRAVARLLAPKGIRVNMVAPGNIFFDGGTWDRKLKKDRRGVEEMLQAQVPLRRLGRVEEVADAVAFLASPRAAFITGSCLVVDGGQTCG